MIYSLSPEYQSKLENLRGKFQYRLDTNYAKIDRIEHEEIESFKKKVLASNFQGLRVSQWAKLFSDGNPKEIILALRESGCLSVDLS